MRKVLCIALFTIALTIPLSSTFGASNCKVVINALQAEERYGKSTHSKFLKSFLKFQKKKSNSAFYWEAFNQKYSVVKSDVKSGNIAASNPACFNANQNSYVNQYVRNRTEMLTALTPYLSQPVNRDWQYSGYAAYTSLISSLKKI